MTLGGARLLVARALAALAALWSLAPIAHANGRMPGATEFSAGRGDGHLIARATYGLVQSFDGGASWQWICEQAINVSGESDPPIALTEDGSLVLLPTVGSSLISRDHGCSWAEAPAPLRGSKAIDLTVDPNNPARVLVVTSTIEEIDARGIVTYTNVLFDTHDNAATWQEVARLRSDFKIETVELAPSNPRRIYVSGTASASPLIGVIERSDDGGASWVRTTIDLPETSGSLFISAIDPGDPDRLWVRVPAQGDRFGLFPASLLFSQDKGVSFVTLGGTNMGMLGFALSPDGKQVAYGGPSDGLFVGPADGSGAFQQSDVRVRCLRWNADGLYACGTEPQDPFSIGRSTDGGATFEPIYKLRDTCPQACGDDSSFAKQCQPAWAGIAQRLSADPASCSVSWPGAAPPRAGASAQDAGAPDAGTQETAAPDAGARDAAVQDAAAGSPDAGRPAPREDRGGCSVADARAGTAEPFVIWLAAFTLLRLRCIRRRRAARRWLALAVTVMAAGCGSEGSEPAQASTGDAGMFAACPAEIPRFETGLRVVGERGRIEATLLEATHFPARKYANEWRLELAALDGDALEDVQVSRVETFMRVHGHYGRPPADFETLAEPGQLQAEVHFTMRGPWEVQIAASSARTGDDELVFEVCVEE